MPEVAELRESLRREVVDAGLSQEQYKDTLQRAGLRSGGTIKVGGDVVFHRCDPADPVYLAPTGRRGLGAREPRRKLAGANGVGVIVAVLGGVLSVCVGVASGVTTLFPSSALWMSGIVCISEYHMVYDTSRYSSQPGQSGTGVNFHCVNGDSSYDVNDLAVFGLQSVLTAFVLCVALAGFGLLRARLRKR